MNDDMRGHNKPPEPTPLERAAQLIEAANEGLRTITRIDDDETGGRCQGFVDQLRDAQADLEAERKARIEPLQAAIDLVRMEYRELLELIELARAGLQPLLDDYLERKATKLREQAEQRSVAARLAQVEADRRRRIADQLGATLQDKLDARRAQERADELGELAKKRSRASIKGEWSERAMSQRSHWSAEITDPQTAVAYYATKPEVIEAVRKLASADARRLKDAGAAPPGIRFVEKKKAQ